MKVNLKKEMFSEKEFVLVENNGMKATAFRYSTGVEAVKIENSKGFFIVLPFQGQQIWKAEFLGKDIVMKTDMKEPVENVHFLETYGGFMLHCGITGLGAPKETDTHPQHGELPNAPYQTAYIECTDDYMAIGGERSYEKSFVKSYSFRPECRLYKDDTVIKIHVTLENRRPEALEYMYLCHINFNPIDGAELIYTANYNNNIVCRGGESEKLAEYMDKLEANPEIHHKVGAEGQYYIPEICQLIDYYGDENGIAHTIQYTDNGAYYVGHPVDSLPFAVRWISRNGKEDSMGMVLPATAEHLGYTNAKNKGQVKELAPKASLSFCIEAGYLEKDRADDMKNKIEKLRKTRN